MREVTTPALYECPEQANAADVVFEHAQAHPHEAAFARLRGVDTWEDISHEQFARDVTSLARGLLGAGVRPGDRVALVSRTRYEWGVIDFAVQAIRAVLVPVYETSSAEQVAWIVSDSGAGRLFVETAEMRTVVDEVRGELGGLTDVWVIDQGALQTVGDLGADIPEDAVHEARAATRSDEVATIVYTSGSTGRPKGCRLTHANLISNSRNALAYVGDFIYPGSATLLFLPLAHVFARIIQLAAFTGRAKVGHQADITQLLPSLASFRPHFLLAVPRVFEKVYNSAEQKAHLGGKGKIFDLAARTAISWSRGKSAGRIPLGTRVLHKVTDKLVGSKLRAALGGRCTTCISGGAPLGERLGHFFRGVGVEVIEGYGLTETSPVSALNSEKANKIGTVGRPLPGTTIRLAEDGEIFVKGPNVFDGYWNNDAATAEAVQDGWLATGDLGTLDDDGFLTITGRKKELIVTAGGKNVAPTLLEDRLRAHPLVSQCIVVGDQRPFIGALITLDQEMLPGWLKEHGLDPELPFSDVLTNDEVRAGLQRAVDSANRAVSQAESIRKFTILPCDLTVEGGQLTPSLKLKRPVVAKEFASEIAALYDGPKPG
ncbi:long-chain fatty acid--CoA ligase [Blastococcus sp. Marseille-P5729]|uniref:AMP-dependent synthetase/ligase n=1 Tax=Blastococcus sp. Marseille-P5729 TaxID=2086582 RepID=UPI000D10B7A4|nr:AMP-dependent synthetase/ligase [Blastococcus sp. Marseille-P5729]